MASTFYVENFGCRAARADGEAVGAWLRDAGLCERQSSEAEVVIVNTCSVTAEADRAARAFIRRAHRLNPEAKIVVTGCYAQRAPGELAGLGGVAAVVGNSHKALVPEIVRGLADAGLTDAGLTDAGLTGAGQAAENNRNLRVIGEEQPSRAKAPIDFAGLMYGLKPIPFTEMGNSAFGQAPIWADDLFAHSFLEGARVVPGAQTRPNLKIQEGCGNRCSFCVIPQTRGGIFQILFQGSQHESRGFPPLRQNANRRSFDSLRSLRMTARMGHGAQVEDPDRARLRGRWRRWCGRSSRGRRSSGCGSARLSRWIGTRN
jgi:threonylcarbamoyladenosine tRNA methylthiotransferase MtaB